MLSTITRLGWWRSAGNSDGQSHRRRNPALTGAQISLLNGGSIRGNRVYAAGHSITRRDILGELPFGNRTVMMEITGRDLKDALENGVSDIDDRGGRFPHVSNVRVAVGAPAPVGSRITAIEFDGKSIEIPMANTKLLLMISCSRWRRLCGAGPRPGPDRQNGR